MRQGIRVRLWIWITLSKDVFGLVSECNSFGLRLNSADKSLALTNHIVISLVCGGMKQCSSSHLREVCMERCWWATAATLLHFLLFLTFGFWSNFAHYELFTTV